MTGPAADPPRSESDWRTALAFLRRFRHLKGKVAAAITFGAVSSALQLLVPLSSAVIINRALPQGDVRMLFGIAAILGATTLVSLGAAYGEFHYSAVFRERAVVELQRDVFRLLQRLPYTYFKTHDSGYTMSRLANDSETAVDMAAGLTQLGRSLSWFGAAFILVPVLHPIIGLVVILVIPLYITIQVKFNSRIRDQFRDVQEHTAQVSRELYESLNGVYETKSYAAEGYRLRRYIGRLATRARSLVRGRQLMALGGHSTQVVVVGVSLFILVYGGFEVIRGRLSLGELVALNALVGYLLMPVNSLVRQGFQVQRSLAAVERLEEILELPVEPRGGVRPSRPARGHLHLSGVEFAYRPGEPVLRGIDLDVAPGETVLFLGPSGVGKSSLLSLLPRFFVPTAGSLTLDGRPLADYDLTWLRRQIAFVSQDSFLFSDSVFQNLRLGRPGATRQEVVEAARAAEALDFITALPDGFDTQVGERGCRLSGGQRQRLAIARALLKDAPILILDEATSAVDRSTETALHRALERLMAGRTTLIVAHHADAFLERVDRVYHLDGGRLVPAAEEHRPPQGRRRAEASIPGKLRQASVTD